LPEKYHKAFINAFKDDLGAIHPTDDKRYFHCWGLGWCGIMRKCEDIADYVKPIRFQFDTTVLEVQPRGYLIQGQDWKPVFKGVNPS
jgi:hypothetical protein